ncbi:archease [Thermodesulfovibrio hydrogeniphilus]
MTYELIDIAGDVGLRITGDSIEELFINAGKGLYSLITEPSTIEAIETKAIEIKADSIEELLVSFLNEIIFLFDAYGFLGREIDVTIHDFTLKAKIEGEYFNPDKHEGKLLLKAATYHDLKIEKKDGKFSARVVFDI